MSDTREIIYNSPSMGRVRLIRNDSEAVWARPSSVEALEVRFREMAARRSSTEVFHLRPSDFDAIAAELERRAGDWKNTAQPLDAFRREYLGVFPPRLTSTTTAGADDVVDAMQYAREGLDKLARRDAAMSLTNDEMRAECSRRNLHRASTETLTDDQLRAECERRRLDHAGIPDQWPVVKALKADVERLTKERDEAQAAQAYSDGLLLGLAAEIRNGGLPTDVALGPDMREWLRKALAERLGLRKSLRERVDVMKRDADRREAQLKSIMDPLVRAEMLKPPPPIIVRSDETSAKAIQELINSPPGKLVVENIARVGSDWRFFHDKKGGAFQETGPGIVGVKVEKDTSAWVLLEDLVAADE